MKLGGEKVVRFFLAGNAIHKIIRQSPTTNSRLYNMGTTKRMIMISIIKDLLVISTITSSREVYQLAHVQ